MGVVRRSLLVATVVAKGQKKETLAELPRPLVRRMILFDTPDLSID